MARKRNPFRIIRITAVVIGSVALVAFFVWLAVAGIIIAVGDDPHILWQMPLAIAVVFGVVFLIAFVCSVIANLWRKAENYWDRKDAS